MGSRCCGYLFHSFTIVLALHHGYFLLAIAHRVGTSGYAKQAVTSEELSELQIWQF